MPLLAMPAANATACDSQMPTSKKRVEKSARTFSSLFPWHIAAVITATRRCCCMMSSMAVVDAVRRRVADQRQPRQQVAELLLGVLVERGEPGAVERLGERADARADRHLVVVEDDQQLAAQVPGVVHRFEHDAGGKRAVADD